MLLASDGSVLMLILHLRGRALERRLTGYNLPKRHAGRIQIRTDMTPFSSEAPFGP
jgi:hypothetical protein